MEQSNGRRSKQRRGGKRGPRSLGPSNRSQNAQRAAASAPTMDSAPLQNGGDLSIHSTNDSQLRPQIPLDSRRFAELSDPPLVHPLIIKTITEDMKFEFMTPVQAATLDTLLPPSRSDCLVQARTGTGKTIAFLLPSLQTMIAQNRGTANGISLLVISPTRELALQIATEATTLLQKLPRYRVRVAIGGTNKSLEEREILNGCEILIATPGRLLDHMANTEILHAFRNLDTLVLDEADRLLDMGFMKDLRQIVTRLPEKKATNRQGMLFSATIAPHVKQVAGLVLSSEYKFISTIPPGEINTHQRVPQFLIEVPSFGLVAAAMVGCIQQESAQHQAFKAILFAPTAALADFYGHVLLQLPGLPTISILHSRMSQNKRTKIVNDYRNSGNAILVATDVVARGMDFLDVTTVIQVGMPADKQSYIHRLGRTARANADGRGILIVTSAESWFPRWTLKEITLIPRDATLASAQEVLSIAEKMDDETKSKIYQAWLGYYNNYLKSLKWDKEELVRQGNVYAREGLGSPDTPPLAKSTASKMGLRGVKGLVTVADRPRRIQTSGNGNGAANRKAKSRGLPGKDP